MRRYELEDWVDYVRGLGDAGRRRAMAEHLATGIDTSVADVRMLEEVRDLIVEDATDGPPEALTWAAEAIAALATEGRYATPLLPLTLAPTAPADAEAARHREAHLGARKLLYRSEQFELDLWIEGPQGVSKSVVLGQIAKMGDGEASAIAEAAVFLLENGDIASSTLTNRFGEFHLEAPAEREVELRIVIRGLGQIRIAIPTEDPEDVELD